MTTEQRLDGLERRLAAIEGELTWPPARIRALRDRLGLTVDGLAARLRVPKNTVARWAMNGPNSRRPSPEMARRLAALEADRG